MTANVVAIFGTMFALSSYLGLIHVFIVLVY